MKKTIVLAMFLVAAAAAVVAARSGGEKGDKSSRCIERKRCEKGQKPPACCKLPPCKYHAQLRQKVIFQGMFADPTMRTNAGGDFDKLTAAIKAKARDGTVEKQLPDCKGEDRTIDDPPALATGDDCKPSDQHGPITEDMAHKRYNTCGEFLAASVSHEEHHARACKKMGPRARRLISFTQAADEEVEGYQIEIKALRDEMSSWLMGCSQTLTGGDLQTKLALEGLEALKAVK